MPRIIAVDYGAKRCGIAETDDLQIIASALDTVSAADLLAYLGGYMAKYPVEALVVGRAVRMAGVDSDIEEHIGRFIKAFVKKYPAVPVLRESEAFTSKMAVQAMVMAGAKKKDRREKGNIDKISATIILQRFLENKRNKQ